MAKEKTMAKQKAVKKILLSLSTLAPEPQYVEIETRDGQTRDFEIRKLDQFGIKDQAKLGAMATRAELFKGEADLEDPKIIDELVNLYTGFVKLAMPDLPAEVLEDLTVPHLESIMVVFTEASGIVMPDAVESPEEN